MKEAREAGGERRMEKGGGEGGSGGRGMGGRDRWGEKGEENGRRRREPRSVEG